MKKGDRVFPASEALLRKQGIEQGWKNNSRSLTPKQSLGVRRNRLGEALLTLCDFVE